MKIPKKVKIAGQIYRIIESDAMKERGKDTLGTTNVYLNNTIWLDNRQLDTQKESTFFHEIIEVINSLYKLGLDEEKICVLETSFYQVLKDNKLLQ